jgi:hypothetical protein
MRILEVAGGGKAAGVDLQEVLLVWGVLVMMVVMVTAMVMMHRLRKG